MKKAAKIGMYGIAARPPSDTPNPCSVSKTYSDMFCTRPGTGARRRPSSTATTSSSPPTIHMVRMVELMPTWNERISPLTGPSPKTFAGAGNSRFPLMKQTGKSHAAPGSPGGKGGAMM